MSGCIGNIELCLTNKKYVVLNIQPTCLPKKDKYVFVCVLHFSTHYHIICLSV